MKNRLRKNIEEKGISIEQLSIATGIGRTTIYQIMNSKCTTNVGYALKLSKFLDVPIEKLFSDEE